MPDAGPPTLALVTLAAVAAALAPPLLASWLYQRARIEADREAGLKYDPRRYDF